MDQENAADDADAEVLAGWDAYDRWMEEINGDDEEWGDKDYLFELFSAAAGSEKCLDIGWDTLMMQGFAFSGRENHGNMLNEDEVKMTANQQYVDWEGFHTELIVKIYENRATNSHNATNRIVSYDNWKYSYIQTMSMKYPAALSDANPAKRQKWKGIVYCLGIEFAKIVESTITTGGDDLWSDITHVLNMHRDWKPDDENSQRKIYYVAGFLINAVKKNAKRNISTEAIELFLSNASLERQAASDANLPIEDVVERELHGLQFASSAFYDVTMKLECVFDSLGFSEGSFKIL